MAPSACEQPSSPLMPLAASPVPCSLLPTTGISVPLLLQLDLVRLGCVLRLQLLRLLLHHFLDPKAGSVHCDGYGCEPPYVSVPSPFACLASSMMSAGYSCSGSLSNPVPSPGVWWAYLPVLRRTCIRTR